MNTLRDLHFTNSFAALPAAFHTRVQPTPLAGNTRLAAISPAACQLLDLDPAAAEDPAFLRVFGGAEPLPGMDPVAALYAGHQFGQYVPQLGDGRALLLGEVTNARGEPWEVQLKGAGLTPYSRQGDGRAVLRSSIREFLCSEAMAALDIPTTRALAVLHGDEEVYREGIESGAILVRLAPSHLRFGNFEVFFYRGQFDRLEQLGRYAIDRHFPGLAGLAQPWLALLDAVIERTARLIAQWQLVGFAHGVMNTDNMSVLGLTIDYGPFGFLDAYDPTFICNHSDHSGRYAFDCQPTIAHWNLSCFAQTLLPLIDPSDGAAAAGHARALLATYPARYAAAWHAGLRAKLGLLDARPDDIDLAHDLLRRMAEHRVDYTNLFRALAGVHRGDALGDAPARDQFIDREAFDQWAGRYRARLATEGRDDAARAAAMNQVNPRYVLRNYLAQQAIDAAEGQDYSELRRLLAVLSRPYDEQPEAEAYAVEPPDWGRRLAVSCSS